MKNLENVADGLYVDASTKAITISPRQICFGKYIIPNTLGHSEHEDIGARIVEASVGQDQWVGMSYRKLSGILVDELKTMMSNESIRYERFKKENSKGFLTRLKEYFLGSEPEPHETEKEITGLPFSILTFQLFTQGSNGPAILGHEIRTMAEKGYINLIEDGDEAYLMPTQKLADAVYKAPKGE